MEMLLVFLRFPQPGKVKTRLVPALGAEGAAQLYRAMAAQVVATARTVARPGLQVRLWVEPVTAVDEARRWLGGSADAYHGQPEGNLGSRLEHAFRTAFADRARRVVVIGTDCIELGPALLDQALTALHDHDAVLGPALDGGYYLLGLRRLLVPVFRDIPWSSSRTAAVTRQRLGELGASLHQLPMLRDIDTPEDLRSIRPGALAGWQQAENDNGSCAAVSDAGGSAPG